MVTDYFDVKLETKDLILKKAEFEDWKTIYYNPVETQRRAQSICSDSRQRQTKMQKIE